MGRRAWRGVACAALAAALVSAWARSASAQDSSELDKSKAREEFERGSVLFAAGDYAAALEKFQAAYDLHPHHKIKYNLGLCHMKLGQRARAMQALEDYVIGEGDAIDQERAHEISILLEEMASKVGVLYFDVEAQLAEVEVDGEICGRTPLKSGVYVEPGEHELRVTATDGFEWHETIEIEAGESREISVRIADMAFPGLEGKTATAVKPEAAAKPAEGPAGVPRASFFSMLALTLAVGAAAGITGGMAVSKAAKLDDLDTRCRDEGCANDTDLYDAYASKKSDTYDSARRLADATTGLLAAAGALAVTSVVLGVLSFSKGKRKEKDVRKASLLPTGDGLVLTVKF
jgi:hypothetical protein